MKVSTRVRIYSALAVRVAVICAVFLSGILMHPTSVSAVQSEETQTEEVQTPETQEMPAEDTQTEQTGENAPEHSPIRAAVKCAGLPAADATHAGETCAEAVRAEQERIYLATHPGIGRTVVLDPGHSAVVAGGSVPLGPGSGERKAADTSGTTGRSSGTTEYQLTMAICQLLREDLEAEGYTVLLTHETNDVAIDCVERARVANDAKADIFVRIHANGSVNSGANGAMTICISPGNPYHPELYAESKKLSEILLDTYCSETGIRKEYVWETDSMTGNNWSEVPCTLLEMGYMTNRDEDLKMADQEFRKKMAAAIVKGIDLYFEQKK